jgi:hypothetical protein
MKYICDKQQWYLKSFLLGVKLWEELHEKSIFWKVPFVILQVNGKGKRWQKDRTCTYVGEVVQILSLPIILMPLQNKI